MRMYCAPPTKDWFDPSDVLDVSVWLCIGSRTQHCLFFSLTGARSFSFSLLLIPFHSLVRCFSLIVAQPLMLNAFCWYLRWSFFRGEKIYHYSCPSCENHTNLTCENTVCVRNNIFVYNNTRGAPAHHTKCHMCRELRAKRPLATAAILAW